MTGSVLWTVWLVCVGGLGFGLELGFLVALCPNLASLASESHTKNITVVIKFMIAAVQRMTAVIIL